MFVKKEDVKNAPLALMLTRWFPKHRNKICVIVTNAKAQDMQLSYSSPLDLVFLGILAVRVRQACPAIRRQG